MIKKEDIIEFMGDAKYMVVTRTEDGDVFFCPLLLSGEETMEQAISRFRDVRNVLADRIMCGKHGFHTVNMERFDGKPTAEQEALAKRLCEQGV